VHLLRALRIEGRLIRAAYETLHPGNWESASPTVYVGEDEWSRRRAAIAARLPSRHEPLRAGNGRATVAAGRRRAYDAQISLPSRTCQPARRPLARGPDSLSDSRGSPSAAWLSRSPSDCRRPGRRAREPAAEPGRVHVTPYAGGGGGDSGSAQESGALRRQV